MNTLLIAYDLGKPDTEERYEDLIDRIKDYDDWAKPEYSTWYIRTPKPAATVCDELQSHLYSGDKLLVITITGDDWATYNLGDTVTNWMRQKI